MEQRSPACSSREDVNAVSLCLKTSSHGAIAKHDSPCVRERCEHCTGEGPVSHACRLVLQREPQQRQQRRVQQRCQVAVLPPFSARVILGAGMRGRVRGTGLRSVRRTYTAEEDSFGEPSAAISQRHRRVKRENRERRGTWGGGWVVERHPTFIQDDVAGGLETKIPLPSHPWRRPDEPA